MRVNVKSKSAVHEAGATQTFAPTDELTRLVSCCLLGERTFYVSGTEVTARIRELCDQVAPSFVASLAVHARKELGLRHVPLVLLLKLAERHHGHYFRQAASDILRTPRDAMDMMAMYRPAKRVNSDSYPIPHCMKAAIRDGFKRWTPYQIAKYGTLTNVAWRLRDLMFIAHPKHAEERREEFFNLANNDLRAPDTWESAISKVGADKTAEWTRLVEQRKLGALALVRNLRNMEQAGVPHALVTAAMGYVKADDVWPWQALAAAREAPAYSHALDDLMLRSAGRLPRIPGKTVVLVDVSGSMHAPMSGKSKMMRTDAAAGLAIVLREVCEEVVIATFSTSTQIFSVLPRGVALANMIAEQPNGGTQLDQAVRAVQHACQPFDRIVVLTDEQAFDRVQFRGRAFVINLAPYQNGVDWDGELTRINGWSGGVIRYLARELTGALLLENEDQENMSD